MSQKAALVEGTSIPKDRMAAMMAASKSMFGESVNDDTPGDQLIDEAEVDHRRIAANLNAARPSLLDDINQKISRRKKTEGRRSRKEGVQGTSPSPGQDDDLGFIPPTTSMVTNPGTLGGEDPEKEVIGEPPGVEHPNERLNRDLGLLFSEDDDEEKNPFAKKAKDDDDEEEDEDEGEDDDREEDDEDEEDDEEDDDKKEAKGKDDDDDDDGQNESVEVQCGKCGYEEEYSLREEDMASNPPPMTTEGQLDTTCPMCGADMDYSLIGATDQEKVYDTKPFTGPRGESGGGEAAPTVESMHYARSLIHRIGEGEDIDALVKEVVESDFIPPGFRFKGQRFFAQAAQQ